MSLADKTLKKLQTKDIFVDIYTDHFDESLYGFISDFNDDFLLLEHYNEDGFYNGIIIFRRLDITRLKWDNNNINSTFKLIERHKPSELASIKIDTIENILKTVEVTFKHVNIHVQNIDSDWAIIGQIQGIDNETVVFKEFGTMSTLDRGMLMISVTDITRIDAGGLYENNLMKIHEKNN